MDVSGIWYKDGIFQRFLDIFAYHYGFVQLTDENLIHYSHLGYCLPGSITTFGKHILLLIANTCFIKVVDSVKFFALQITTVQTFVFVHTQPHIGASVNYNEIVYCLLHIARMQYNLLPRHSLWSSQPSIMIAFRLFSSIIIKFPSMVENSSIITAHYRTTFRQSQLTSVTTIHH